MRKGLVSIFLLFMVFEFTGCSTTPEPKKIDIASIPVDTGPMPQSPGSLWPGETLRNTLFQDPMARHVGDTVTIIISEKTSATREATTSTSRSSSADIGITKFLGFPMHFGLKGKMKGGDFDPSVAGEYETAFEGEGTTTRSGELTAQLTARVVEVLPNGNLVIEGRKETLVNNELQYIVLSGIIRPEDISPQNTIASAYIADARIEYSGKGVITDEQRPGWLRRILDHVWPF